MNPLSIPNETLIDDLAGALSESFAPIVYSAGASIFHESDPGGHAYIIERGQVKITRDAGTDQKVVAILGPGELLGEMSLIDDERRSATATAITETEIIPISSGQSQDIVDNADPLIQLLLRVLIERLRNTRPDTERAPGGIRLLDDEMKDRSIESVRGRALNQLKAEKELRDAFTRREFDLYFQPIVRLRDYRLAGFEGLLRWLSPERGVIGPDEFIGLAEETGLIVPMGLWVVEHACHMLKRFQAIRDRHYPDEEPLFMSANVSARQLRDLRHVDSIIATIRRTGVDPSAIKIEITEGLLLEDPKFAITAFNRLKALGVAIALDDFGTGYSSLSYLHRFPLDTLKIDRSFVMSMLKSRDSMTVIRTITGLARDLKLDCVSEGIEDPRELTTLKDFGCEYGQGHLFSRPVPEKEVLELLARDQLWEPGEQTANSHAFKN